MALFEPGARVPVWFGDFGGNASAMELDGAPAAYVADIEALLPTEEFEHAFRSALSVVMTEGFDLEGLRGPRGERILVAPDASWRYILAGQVALAVCHGDKGIASGTASREVALAAAHACRSQGIELVLSLSRELSHDEGLVAELEALGCHLDTTTSDELYDLPHLNVMNVAEAMYPEFRVAPFRANAFGYPFIGIASLLASVYGRDLLEATGVPATVVAPVTDGTEAVAALGAYLGTGCTVATSEQPICGEFHNGVTLLTRAADTEGWNTVLCAELANWWRTGVVRRWGCDRYRAVDAKPWLEQGFSLDAARALALALEAEHADDATIVMVGR